MNKISKDLALALVSARREHRALPVYPGDIPVAMADSYAIQDEAIKLWDEPIIGWKIGRLAPERQAHFGTQRLTGPIFTSRFSKLGDTAETVNTYKDGFAAVEAEYIIEIKHDTDPSKTDYSLDEAFDLIGALYCGIEMAGSPLPDINRLGPTVVASDFGNNNGLILGEKLLSQDKGFSAEDLSLEAIKAYQAETFIDGQSVGKGGLFTMPEGPIAAIAWIAGHLAGRAMPLKAGALISSGATTGIHDIKGGQSSIVRFTSPNGIHEMALTARDFS